MPMCKLKRNVTFMIKWFKRSLINNPDTKTISEKLDNNGQVKHIYIVPSNHSLPSKSTYMN